MSAIAEWVRAAQPEAVVVDVSVEVATFVRLLGIPVVVVALPGTRTDAPHRLVHTIADRIIAAWPRELRVPTWLQPHDDKTVYVGGISRFDGRPRAQEPPGSQIVVLSGAEGMSRPPPEAPTAQNWTWLGGRHGQWIADPWPHLTAADVIVTHAGQNSIADIAAAERPAVVIPQIRPHDEQVTTATVLDTHRMAAVSPGWPKPQAWPELLARARAIDTRQWRRWRVQGAAARAAAVIEETARQCRGRVPA